MYDRATVDAGTGSARGFCARSRHSMRSTGRRWRPNVPVQTHGIFGRRCKPCSRRDGSKHRPIPPDMLLVIAAEGWLTLTEKGQARLQDESV